MLIRFLFGANLGSGASSVLCVGKHGPLGPPGRHAVSVRTSDDAVYAVRGLVGM